MNLSAFKNQKGVYHLSEIKTNFSNKYLALRKKENRILSDKEVKLLPQTSNQNSNYSEWKIRRKTVSRFINYLQNKNQHLTILDVGCGNGWFSNKMSELGNVVIGLDINLEELEQASRVFNHDNLQFVYADFFNIEPSLFYNKFDIISLNASVQYFSDFELLILTLKQFLKPTGEIHILDSPFYDVSEIDKAKKRTLIYYTKIGFPEMSNYYFHHTKENIKDFDVLYKPKKSLINKIFGENDSPFMWLKLLK